MRDNYFSDRERDARPRDIQEIQPPAWGGIVSLVESLVGNGAFGIDYPDKSCQDEPVTIGTNARAFSLALKAEVPDLEWLLRTTMEQPDQYDRSIAVPWAPPTMSILDLVEFCHAHVAQTSGSLHSYFGHYHLSFNREAGQADFRARINLIFARNGLAYEILDTGRVERLAPTVLREALAGVVFRTGDAALDGLLNQARAKFFSPDPDQRRDALEKLWDAWERLKSIENAADKKLSVALLLDKASPQPAFRAALENEARELTRIGNEFRIRHSEIGTVPIDNSDHIDYLFHRLFALLFLAMRRR